GTRLQLSREVQWRPQPVPATPQPSAATVPRLRVHGTRLQLSREVQWRPQPVPATPQPSAATVPRLR
ncbi:hypothetical protein C7E12_23620, partial [Stenotrophomonas maltophilia]